MTVGVDLSNDVFIIILYRRLRRYSSMATNSQTIHPLVATYLATKKS